MTKHHPTPTHLPASRAGPLDQDARLMKDYAHYLSDMELSEDQQKELLSTLWQIMVAFVDLGFNVKAGDKLGQNSDIGFDDVLNYLCLDDTAPETLASSKTTNKKEKP